jgi:hypothetical protein
MFLPALLSVFGWFAQVGLFCTGQQRGANVEHGLVLAQSAAVLLAGAVAVLLFVSRDVMKWRYVIAGACVAEAAVVAGAIAFVAVDSSTVVWTGCGFMGPATNEVANMSWLYYIWGFSIAALLYQAVLVARYSPREPQPEAEPDLTGPPVD